MMMMVMMMMMMMICLSGDILSKFYKSFCNYRGGSNVSFYMFKLMVQVEVQVIQHHHHYHYHHHYYHHHYHQGVSIYISTLSLTAIALDRLEAVTQATTMISRTSSRQTVNKIILINTISIIAILPYCLHMEVSFQNIQCFFRRPHHVKIQGPISNFYIFLFPIRIPIYFQ